MKSQRSDPSLSYVNHVPKSVFPWCTMLMPQPDSDPAGERHHSACTLNVATGPAVRFTVPVAPAKFRGEFTAAEPSRLSDRLPDGSTPCTQMSEPSPQSSVP